MSQDSIALIQRYFPELTSTQQDQFAQLYPLYHHWNEQINVISRKDIDALYLKHVLHSLAIAKIISFKENTKILDVGTGGGFPGIPLAILFPEVHFVLVDSIAKKIKVVNEVSQSIELQNVEAYHQRAEKVKGQFDFVVSRAVTRMKPFLQWVNQKISPRSFNELDNGILYLKGGDLNAEMREIKRPYQELNIQNYFNEAFFETKKVVYVPM